MRKALLTCGSMLSDEYITALNQMFDLEVSGCKLNGAELAEHVHDKEVYILGGNEKVTLSSIKESALRHIIFLGIQYETFFTEEALAFCKSSGIEIIATGGGKNAVATTTIEEIISFARQRQVQTARLFKSPASAFEILKSLKIVVVGAGDIGQLVLDRLIKYGCRNLAYAGGRGPKEEINSKGIPYIANLEDAFSADIITVHSSYVPEATSGFIKIGHMLKISKGGLFLNNARAELVDPNDLSIFLIRRQDVSVVFDTFYIEGLAFDRLIEQDNLYSGIIGKPSFSYTGHTAAMRQETYKEYGEKLLQIVKEQKLS